MARQKQSAGGQVLGCLSLTLVALVALAVINPSWLSGSNRPSRTQAPSAANTQGAAQSGFATIQPSPTFAESSQRQAEISLGRVSIADLNSVLVNEDIATIVIDFQILGSTNIPAAERQMGEMLCAIRSTGPNGYILRFAGRMGNGITAITTTVSPTAIEAVNCSQPQNIDWLVISDEYNLASGLQNGATSPTVPANTFQCPANCDEAVARGLTAQQAGQCSNLDRDNDGLACYGD